MGFGTVKVHLCGNIMCGPPKAGRRGGRQQVHNPEKFGQGVYFHVSTRICATPTQLRERPFGRARSMGAKLSAAGIWKKKAPHPMLPKKPRDTDRSGNVYIVTFPDLKLPFLHLSG